METLVIDYENAEELFRLFASFAIGLFTFASGLYTYLKKKGIKLAPIEKVHEYQQLKDFALLLTKNVSREELINIVNFVIKNKTENKTITMAVVQEAGMMLFDAITTEDMK